MVKLVDTPDSKSGSFAGVAVQVRPLVPSLRYLATPRTPVLRVKPLKIRATFYIAIGVQIVLGRSLFRSNFGGKIGQHFRIK